MSSYGQISLMYSYHIIWYISIATATTMGSSVNRRNPDKESPSSSLIVPIVVVDASTWHQA